jgi:hypothetical protein
MEESVRDPFEIRSNTRTHPGERTIDPGRMMLDTPVTTDETLGGLVKTPRSPRYLREMVTSSIGPGRVPTQLENRLSTALRRAERSIEEW